MGSRIRCTISSHQDRTSNRRKIGHCVIIMLSVSFVNCVSGHLTDIIDNNFAGEKKTSQKLKSCVQTARASCTGLWCKETVNSEKRLMIDEVNIIYFIISCVFSDMCRIL